MTLPNKLSVFRILLTFVIMGLLFVPGWISKVCALACFFLASLTDWLDGYLARRLHKTSPLGALLDPIADKVLILGIFLAFVQLRLIPGWMVLIMALREFVITGVRLVAANFNVVLPAAREGKHKTVSQMVAIVVILIVLSIEEAMQAAISVQVRQWLHLAMLVCVWVAMVLTLISGASFFWRHRSVLRDAVSR